MNVPDHDPAELGLVMSLPLEASGRHAFAPSLREAASSSTGTRSTGVCPFQLADTQST
jgi:hypothetical protein